MISEMYLSHIIYILQFVPVTTSNLACEHLNTFVLFLKLLIHWTVISVHFFLLALF